MMNVLYVTDNRGIEMLVASLLSLHKTVPDSRVFILFTEDKLPLPEIFDYEYLELSSIQKEWVAKYPKMNRSDGRVAPKTTFYKIPALYSLPDDIDEVVYLDIDTMILSDFNDIFSKFTGYIGGCHSLGSLKANQPFNAGVIAFRRSLMPDGFDTRYHNAVMESNGNYGDQEVFRRMNIRPEMISPIYNSRKKLPSTRILHVYGTKPFETHPVAVKLSEDEFVAYWKDIAGLSHRPERGLGKDNTSSEIYYLRCYREAVSWLESNVPNYCYVHNSNDKVRNSLKLNCTCCK